MTFLKCTFTKGFTPGERARFRTILAAGGLVDAYRTLHVAETAPDPESAAFTWRGAPPANLPVARYYGRAMRIDHALLSAALVPRVQRCDILGRGRDRLGFLGSDHSPIVLALGPAGEADAGAAPAQAAAAGAPVRREVNNSE